MKKKFLSVEQRSQLVAAIFIYNENSRLSSLAKERDDQIEFAYQAIEAEFDVWAFMRKHLSRVLCSADFNELYQEFSRIFEGNTFAYKEEDRLEEKVQKFSQYLGREHARVSRHMHGLRLQRTQIET